MTDSQAIGAARGGRAPIVLLALLAGAGLVAAWLLRGGDAPAEVARARERGAVLPDTADRAPRLVDGPGRAAGPARSVRAEVPAPAGTGDAVPGEGRPREVPIGTPGATVVQVQLTDEGGVPLALEGVEVEAQTWLEASSATFRHRSRTDASGLATFAFEGSVHVDWFLHDPRRGSSLPFLYDEHHLDVEAGERMHEILPVVEGGSVGGRVVDTTGVPVAGVELHLYREYYMGELADTWRPGIATAVSGEDGAFRFPSLAAVYWSLAIPPFEYVQVSPSLTGEGSGGTHFEPGVGETLDVGTFVVAPLARVELGVTDVDGGPVEGAVAWLAPRSLAVPGLALQSEEEVEELERWLLGEEPWLEQTPHARPWPFAELQAATDPDGEAVLLATPGAWTLTVRHSVDGTGQPLFEEALELELPCGPVEVTVPSRFRPVAGRVVDLRGAPLAGVGVVASASAAWGAHGVATSSGPDGRFSFEAVPADRPLWLHLRGLAVLPAVHAVQDPRPGSPPDAAEPPTYAARRSARLSARVEVKGERHHLARWSVTIAELDALDPPATDFERRFAEELQARDFLRLSVHGGSSLSLEGLWPGTYHVVAFVLVGTDEFDSRTGAPRSRLEAWSSTVLATDDPDQLVTVDLTGYEPPRNQPQVGFSGRVHDRVSGEPVDGALLRLEAPGWVRHARVQADGRFAASAPDEPFSLTVRAPGYAPFARAMERASTLGESLWIDLEPCPTRLALRVRSKDGRLLPALHLAWTDADGAPALAFLPHRGEWAAEGWARPEAALELSSLPPGDYAVAVDLEGLGLGTFPLRVGDGGGVQEHTLTLAASASDLRRALAER